MKPLYSIQELADALSQDIYSVADGLSACGVTPFSNGRAADLTRWNRPITDYGNGNIYIMTGGTIVPDPNTVIVSTDSLPDSWKRSIEAADVTVPVVNEVATEKAAPSVHPNDWRESARAIADECFERDTRNNCRDSLKGYSRRVMDEMQKRMINAPRGLIDNPKTIQREALQGANWWVGKAK